MSVEHSTSPTNDDAERWAPIPDCPGYEVSTEGRVRSYWRWTTKKERIASGIGYFCVGDTPRFLSVKPGPIGYSRVQLTLAPDVDGVRKRKFFYVHYLVLTVFIGPRPPGMDVLHVENPDRADNRLSNLRWGTPTENSGSDLIRHYGKHPCSSLRPDDVREIRRRLAKGDRRAQVARDYKVSTSSIDLIATRKHHAYIED